ncbi:hypothetical protein NDA13_000015 [Ustilago tritici]|nr:hypothetical protein NDA13_000015 [Ustilago tritici]
MAGLDLDQIQAELELKRSALADSILSKLPGLSAPQQESASSSRPRQANLGLGATPKQQPDDDAGSNRKTRSAADLRLKGALTSKRKRWQNDELVPQRNGGAESEEEQASRADAIGSSSKKARQNGSANGIGGGKKDPFAAKGIEAQKAAQNQPRIVVVDGEQVDLSKLSKAQRKKINKQLKAQERLSTTPSEQDKRAAATPTKPNTAQSPTRIASNSSTSVTGPAVAGMTALQAQMLSKLSGSRFRTINEKLYTTASEEAVKMIDAQPHMFDEYHQGFRKQVRGWPKNPLDHIVELFHPASASTTKGKGKAKSSPATTSTSKYTKAVKARFTPGALVVDFGAGEGGLAKKLIAKGGGEKVLCYDLINTSDGWVRKQDSASIGGLPLPGYFNSSDPLGLTLAPEVSADGQADVAVFCLSLMGTNWIHMLLEAKRVLRTGGELIVAEVSSRFDGAFDRFVAIVKALGFGLEVMDSKNTHFVLFEFIKLTLGEHEKMLKEVEGGGKLQGLGEGEVKSLGLHQLAEFGKGLLKPCIYKRR